VSEIILSPSQDKACIAFRKFIFDDKKREFLLSGFAGAGKSFLVKFLVDVTADEYRLVRLINPKAIRYRFHFTATTNKAAGVLTGLNRKEKAMTIHKTLGLVVQKNYETGASTLKAARRGEDLSQTILVVDEASMVNRELLAIIRKVAFSYPNCKILYVGDKYQLPPVQEDPCSLFDSLDERYFLTEIQRQAADSPIISFAHHYREILDDPEKPWPAIPHDGENIFHYNSRTAFDKAILDAFQTAEKSPDIDVANLKVISWSNDRVRSYSKKIREFLGYDGDFCVGETVASNSAIKHPFESTMLAATDSYWTIDNIRDAIEDDIPGYRLTLIPHDHEYEPFHIFQPKSWGKANALKKKYAGEKKWRDFFKIEETWADMRPIYAQTVHKSQGSTYDEVFIDVSDIARNNKFEEIARLMYVAITRARFRVHILGQLPERYNRVHRDTISEVFHNAAKITDPWATGSSREKQDNPSEKICLGDILQ
jgi:hypothetical protein